MNEGDQLVSKISFTLDLLIDNFEGLQDKMDQLTRTYRCRYMICASRTCSFSFVDVRHDMYTYLYVPVCDVHTCV